MSTVLATLDPDDEDDAQQRLHVQGRARVEERRQDADQAQRHGQHDGQRDDVRLVELPPSRSTSRATARTRPNPRLRKVVLHPRILAAQFRSSPPSSAPSRTRPRPGRKASHEPSGWAAPKPPRTRATSTADVTEVTPLHAPGPGPSSPGGVVGDLRRDGDPTEAWRCCGAGSAGPAWGGDRHVQERLDRGPMSSSKYWTPTKYWFFADRVDPEVLLLELMLELSAATTFFITSTCVSPRSAALARSTSMTYCG